MVIALGVVVAAFIVTLVVGAVTGRVKVKSCCAVADPRRDLRMRDAFSDATPTSRSKQAMSVSEDSRS